MDRCSLFLIVVFGSDSGSVHYPGSDSALGKQQLN